MLEECIAIIYNAFLIQGLVYTGRKVIACTSADSLGQWGLSSPA